MIAIAGSEHPRKLSPAHVMEAVRHMENRCHCHSTLVTTQRVLRRMLRTLWADYGAPKLDDLVPRGTAITPRNVVVRDEELQAILKAARPALRLWLLLCSDLALRSNTAAHIGPEHYDQAKGTIRFRTKFDTKQVLPITAEIKAILDTCDQTSEFPFVWQIRERQNGRRGPLCNPKGGSTNNLRTEFRQLRKKLGITRQIVAHDLRRTTAVAMLNHTLDLRSVQALLGHRQLSTTLWYLDQELKPVKRSNLEIIKRPAWARKDKSA